eukprot:gene29159-32383_t
MPSIHLLPSAKTQRSLQSPRTYDTMVRPHLRKHGPPTIQGSKNKKWIPIPPKDENGKSLALWVTEKRYKGKPVKFLTIPLRSEPLPHEKLRSALMHAISGTTQQ